MLPALVVVVAAFLLLVAWGDRRWRSATRALRLRLEAERVSPRSPRFAAEDLAGLPPPVQRYLRAVLTPGQPIVAAADLEHEGTFDMGGPGARWVRFTSNQRVITRRPGFDWDSRMSMLPGAVVRVHDAYVAGEGILHAAVLGLVTVVDQHGTGDLAHGELMRFLAEAVWYPTVLLPGQGTHWEAIDDRSARATLADGDVAPSLLFRFGDGGLIDSVHAEARGRTVGGGVVPTPWQGRFWNWSLRGAMWVPLDGEVAWIQPDGPRTYWRGHLTRLDHEFAS